MHRFWRAFLNNLSREWKVVSGEDARKNQYFGIRGWLFGFYIFYAVALFSVLFELFLPLDPQDLKELYGGNPYLMRGVELMFLATFVPFLILAPLKHRLTPKFWIGGIALGALVSILPIVFAVLPQIELVVFIIFLGIVLRAPEVLYILSSKRVNVTFLHRIPVAVSPTNTLTSSSEVRADRKLEVFWPAVIIVIVIVLFAFF